MAELRLEGGKVAIVDNDVASDYASWPWRVAADGNVCATILEHDVLLSRVVIGATIGDRKTAAHSNGDKLDCRRANLLVADKVALGVRRVVKRT